MHVIISTVGYSREEFENNNLGDAFSWIFKLSNEDTLCLIGYYFEPKYSTHELKEIFGVWGLEDSSRGTV